MTSAIPASIEVSPKHVIDNKLTPGMLPEGTRVYITDVGVDPLADYIAAARRIGEMNYAAVPHVPARRIESAEALKTRLSALKNEAGVDDILVIAGEADTQMGPFSQSLEVLQTGLIDQLGISHVAIGGHPEGNIAYGKLDPTGVLKDKLAFGAQMDAQMRIVTQFGFDGQKFVKWAEDIAAAGVTAPVHLGVAGPAKVTTLIKYAALCGVGNSLNFFKKRTSAIAQLATKHSPEDVVSVVEKAWKDGRGNIAQMHVFPFGGLQSSADWLTRRGSFSEVQPAA